MTDFTRRLVLQSAAFALCGIAREAPAYAAKGYLPLWPEMPPGGGGPLRPERINDRGAVKDVRMPHLRPYFPTINPTGAAVLIAGGGGYKSIGLDSEEHPAAVWLTRRGIMAFELVYRLPNEGWGSGPLAPLQDAQRAIRIIRASAASFGIKKNRVGVLGFSAGGHLLGMAAARPHFQSYFPEDGIDVHSARPDNAALIYPIISLLPPFENTLTRKELVGDNPSLAQLRAWSVQTYVTQDCPTMFLVQALDDTISNPENTVIMERACNTANVPVVLHQLANGGHGFGMGRQGSDTKLWPNWYYTWLAEQRFV